jgi:hypothetical protein
MGKVLHSRGKSAAIDAPISHDFASDLVFQRIGGKNGDRVARAIARVSLLPRCQDKV